MYRNFYLVSLFAGYINLGLAILAISLGPKRRLNQLFCLTALGLAWWNFGVYSISQARISEDSFIRIKTTLYGIIFLPSAFYHLSFYITKQRIHRRTLYTLYTIAFFFLIANITDHLIVDVRPYSGYFRGLAGPVFYLFCLGYYPIATLASFSLIVRAKTKFAGTATCDRHILLFAIGLLFAGGMHDMIPLLGIDYYPGTQARIITWGTMAAATYGIMVAYCIFNNRQTDFRVSFGRFTAFFLRACFFSGIAHLLMNLAGVLAPDTFTVKTQMITLAVIATSTLLSLLLFPYLFGSLVSRAESVFLGDIFRKEDKFAEFGMDDGKHTVVQPLLNEATELLCDELRLFNIGIYIPSADKRFGGTSVYPQNGNLEKILNTIAPVLFDQLSGSSEPYLEIRQTTDTASCPGETDGANRDNFDLAFPIQLQPGSLLGVLCFGKHLVSNRITNTDVRFLNFFCRNLAVRIERILLKYARSQEHDRKAIKLLLASIGHEIRNPLSAMEGVVSIAEERLLQAHDASLFTVLKGCVEQLRSTVDDVFDFAKTEGRGLTYRKSDTNIVALIESTCGVHNLRETLIRFTPPETLDVCFVCDAGKIRQILSNFCINAVKYGCPPGGTVTATLIPRASLVSEVTISVTSKGALTAQEIARLFQPCSRGRRAQETGAPGSGLGLSLCKKLAAAIGGEVGASSTETETTFWLRVSLSSATEKPRHIEVTKKYSGARILAIEDEDFNRYITEVVLSRLGMSVMWARTGEEALSRSDYTDIDLILTDWLLPDMEASRIIQGLRDKLNGTTPPVFVVSGFSNSEKKQQSIAAGAAAFISKPIDPIKLVSALDAFGFKVPSRDISPRPASVLTVESAQELVFRGEQLAQLFKSDRAAAPSSLEKLRQSFTALQMKSSFELVSVLDRGLRESWTDAELAPLVTRTLGDISRITTPLLEGNPSATKLRPAEILALLTPRSDSPPRKRRARSEKLP